MYDILAIAIYHSHKTAKCELIAGDSAWAEAFCTAAQAFGRPMNFAFLRLRVTIYECMASVKGVEFYEKIIRGNRSSIVDRENRDSRSQLIISRRLRMG